MKLRQKEYCHNCDQHVMFEFEECNGQQVIDCPNCGHKHYRELDDATLLDIRMDMMMRPGMRVAVPKKTNNTFFVSEADVPYVRFDVDVREVVAIVDGKVAVKPKEGEDKTKVVTDRRWGVDPSQRRA